MVKELEKLVLTGGETQAKASDRVVWGNLIVALCPSRDDESMCETWPAKSLLTIYFKGKSSVKPDHMRGDKFSW